MCFNSRKSPLAVFLDIQIEAHTPVTPCLPTLIAFNKNKPRQKAELPMENCNSISLSMEELVEKIKKI